MAEPIYKRAPPGFTPEQREQFDRDGFIVIESVLDDQTCDRYIEVIDRIAAADPHYDPSKTFSRDNAVEQDPLLAELIDHPAHVGYMYDLFGELLKLHLSQILIRPSDCSHNFWHPDGARAVPYGVVAPERPVVTKVAYWLTDLPERRMGNLVLMPGSHRRQYFDSYDTHEDVDGQHIVRVRRGTVTIADSNTWHRVEPNESSVVRKNIFLAYCLSWICPQDRYQNDPAWLETLTRERRIIMRSYRYPYDNAKPPPEDFPLYLDRETGRDRDPGMYRDHVKLHRRKRKLVHEQ